MEKGQTLCPLEEADDGVVYMPLLRSLRNDIAMGRIKSMEFLPGEKSLASEFEISRWGVREALDVLVRENRVRKIPGKGTVVVGNNGTTPAEPRTLDIQVIIDTTARIDNNLHALRYMQFIKEHGPELPTPTSVTFSFMDFTDSESEGQNTLNNPRAEATVVVPFSRQCLQFMESFHPGNRSVFCLGRELSNPDVPQVFVDHATGTHKAIEYLLLLGHREILTISPPAAIHIYAAVREQATIKTMQDYGCDNPERLIKEALHDYGEILAILKERLASPTRPTAIFLADGRWLDVTRHALSALSCDVPEDISLLTYDVTTERGSELLPVTGIHQPIEHCAMRMLETVLAHCRSRADIPPRQTIIPELIVRESCRQLSEMNVGDLTVRSQN